MPDGSLTAGCLDCGTDYAKRPRRHATHCMDASVACKAVAAHLIRRHKVHLHARVHGQHIGQGAHGAAVGLQTDGKVQVSSGGKSGAGCWQAPGSTSQEHVPRRKVAQ